jgi:hypothetical protein
MTLLLALHIDSLKRGGSSVGQSSGLIIRRSQVQVLPAPPIYLRVRRQKASQPSSDRFAPPPCRHIATVQSESRSRGQPR